MAIESNEFYWYLDQEKKGIVGSMNDQGIVTFVIEAGVGSSIRGTTYFKAMMGFFGNDAKAIHGFWLRSAEGKVSTNIDKVNELTALGVALENAVLQAWTVTRAMKLGFSKVRLLGVPKGSPGAYTKVEVLIEK